MVQVSLIHFNTETLKYAEPEPYVVAVWLDKMAGHARRCVRPLVQSVLLF